MNNSEIKKAQELSARVAALGHRPVTKILKKVPSPFKYQYNALKIKDGKDGRDGKDINEDAVVARVVEILKQHLPSIDEEAVFERFLEKMRKEKSLDVSHLRNAEQFIFAGTKYKTSELMHGGSSATTTTSVYNEVVSGSGIIFTLVHIPVSGTVVVYGNGQRLTPGAGNDYTISGAIITTTNSYSAGQILADYTY